MAPPLLTVSTDNLVYSRPPSPASSSIHSPDTEQENSPISISAHPYARIYSRSSNPGRRARQLWSHAFEKYIFTEEELLSTKAPERRRIYISSLESHIEELHSQLHANGIWPVPYAELDNYFGLNAKVAKSMVSGLQHDSAMANWKVLELSRAKAKLEEIENAVAQPEKQVVLAPSDSDAPKEQVDQKVDNVHVSSLS